MIWPGYNVIWEDEKREEKAGKYCINQKSPCSFSLAPSLAHIRFPSQQTHSRKKGQVMGLYLRRPFPLKTAHFVTSFSCGEEAHCPGHNWAPLRAILLH